MTRTTSRARCLLIIFSLGLCACAGPNRLAARAPHINFTDLNTGDHKAQLAQLSRPPYIVKFKAGDRVPFSFAVESKLFEADIPPLTIMAKRDFYLLFRTNRPPLLSEDGVDFKTRAQNSFMFGFRLHEGEDAQVVTKISVRAK